LQFLTPFFIIIIIFSNISLLFSSLLSMWSVVEWTGALLLHMKCGGGGAAASGVEAQNKSESNRSVKLTLLSFSLSLLTARKL
jgi:hypothetical protein